jgi:two-component system chemotaxis response regulator CheB
MKKETANLFFHPSSLILHPSLGRKRVHMAGHDIIVIGASAGGVKVLSQLARGLPPGLPASIFITTHISAGSASILPELLSRAGPLLAKSAQQGEPISPGHIYLAPPDHHLLFEDGQIQLSRGPRENHHRPAIDPMFRSAARNYGQRVVGVVLTGGMTDGIAGLMAVRAGGGITVVQDPDDADVPDLPRNAQEIVGADHLVTADQLAPLLVDLIRQPASADGDPAMSEIDPIEELPAVMDADAQAMERGARRGALTVFTCPECGGTLWQVDQDKLVRFRCHVGHSYVGGFLLDEQSLALEAALWRAVRIFKEKSVLARLLAAQQRASTSNYGAERFEEEARQSEYYSRLIQEYILENRKDRKRPPPDEEFGSKSPETGKA